MPEMSEPRAYWVRLPDGSEYGPGSLTLMAQWTSEGRVPRSATLVTRDGKPPIPVTDQPELRAIFEGRRSPILAASEPDDALAMLVPYRNMPALWGYYVGIAALIPGLGLLLGPTALALGAIGIRLAKNKPHAHGAAHGWVGVALGGIATLLNWGGITALVVGWVSR